MVRTLTGAQDPDPRKQAMTLEHLLMMRSGFYCDDGDPAAPGNEDTLQSQTDDPDYYHYSLNVPLAAAPDQRSVYCSMSPNLALGVVGRATAESGLDTFDRRVGGPLRITRYAWPLDPVGHAYGGGGVRALPRDFMKLGQLMLDGGVWHGHRILGREFVARASAPLHDLNGIQYGYLWWSIEYPYKDRTVRAFFAAGNGGQAVMVVPSLDLVIAIYGGNYSDPADRDPCPAGPRPELPPARGVRARGRSGRCRRAARVHVAVRPAPAARALTWVRMAQATLAPIGHCRHHTGHHHLEEVMKKSRQRTESRPRSLQSQDLASIRGGDNGVLHMQLVPAGPPVPNDNGVLHML
ncbi:MAG TPA: serine hydrolase [Kofleriaceae bacterium]|nr:serine hydrolase [Kofleriaceae bacterium]